MVVSLCKAIARRQVLGWGKMAAIQLGHLVRHIGHATGLPHALSQLSQQTAIFRTKAKSTSPSCNVLRVDKQSIVLVPHPFGYAAQPRAYDRGACRKRFENNERSSFQPPGWHGQQMKVPQQRYNLAIGNRRKKSDPAIVSGQAL